MAFDYSKLLGRITEKMGTQVNFTKRMRLSERTISLKLNEKVPLKQDEIIRASEILDIPKEEISAYFFTTGIQFG